MKPNSTKHTQYSHLYLDVLHSELSQAVCVMQNRGFLKIPETNVLNESPKMLWNPFNSNQIHLYHISLNYLWEQVIIQIWMTTAPQYKRRSCFKRILFLLWISLNYIDFLPFRSTFRCLKEAILWYWLPPESIKSCPCICIRERVSQFFRNRSEVLHTSTSHQKAAHLWESS